MIDCSQCKVPFGKRVCSSADGATPADCTTASQQPAVEKAKQIIQEDKEILRFLAESSRQEASGYERDERTGLTRPVKPRIIEVVEFCKRMGYRKIGLAFCGGLVNEAKVVGEILSTNGFEVVSAICKVGAVDKSFLGLKDEEKIHGPGFEPMCNPVGQAMIMNEAKTEFNILLGLCVGHDSLFLKYSEAMCTVLAVKDRVMCHNPLGAIYSSDTYYKYVKN